MKLFSVEEANELLPVARRILENIKHEHARVVSFGESARGAAAGAESGGGGILGGAEYASALMNMTEHVSLLQAYGIQLKDHERGLIDFPSLRNGRVVLLCWQLGEEERIAWWHETDAGFAGRQPL